MPGEGQSKSARKRQRDKMKIQALDEMQRPGSIKMPRMQIVTKGVAKNKFHLFVKLAQRLSSLQEEECRNV